MVVIVRYSDLTVESVRIVLWEYTNFHQATVNNKYAMDVFLNLYKKWNRNYIKCIGLYNQNIQRFRTIYQNA